MRNTTLLKGLGILLIITHNYMHWLPQCVAENEYTFSLERISLLTTYLSQGGPHVFLNILSHYGHYGVAIFLFLSGYGLVKKYEKQPLVLQSTSPELPTKPKSENFLLFIWRHALKLWKLMLPALLLYVVIELALGTWNRPWDRLLPLIGFYSNLMPERDLILGPWWWFGLMMQLYILWRIIIYKQGKFVLYGIMTLCLSTLIFQQWKDFSQLDSEKTLSCWMHYNFPAAMLAFGLGVAHGRYNLTWLYRWWSPIVGMILIVVGSFNAGIWTLAPIGVIMVAFAFVSKPSTQQESTSRTRIYNYIAPRNILVFLGKISPWLFALHPVVRAYTIKLAKMDSEPILYLSIVIYLIVCIVLAWVFTWLSKKKILVKHNK